VTPELIGGAGVGRWRRSWSLTPELIGGCGELVGGRRPLCRRRGPRKTCFVPRLVRLNSAPVDPRLALLCLGAYLLGAVPFGVLITRLVAKRDVREVGSGNIGATNVARAAGRTAGIVTLLLDAAKGALAAYLGLHFFGTTGGCLAGGAAFCGHVFPVYLGFRGGKGVATGLGVFAVLAPAAAAVGLATYLVVFALTRISGLGSLIALVASGVAIGVIGDRSLVILYLATGSVMVWRHRKNIQQFLASRRRAP
jgi:glycerol-3-phosphate acyltransferase PlsY